MITFKISKDQYKTLQSAFTDSGMRNFSEYIREVLLHSKNKPRRIFTPEVLPVIRIIGTQIGQIGDNIYQLTRLAHGSNQKGKLNSEVFELFNQQMLDYLKAKKELIKVFRTVMRSK